MSSENLNLQGKGSFTQRLNILRPIFRRRRKRYAAYYASSGSGSDETPENSSIDSRQHRRALPSQQKTSRTAPKQTHPSLGEVLAEVDAESDYNNDKDGDHEPGAIDDAKPAKYNGSLLAKFLPLSLVGSEPKIQKLYEGPPTCSCCINWVKEFPDDAKEAIEETPKSKKRALVVRIQKNHGKGQPLTIHSIVVQSPLIKPILKKIFEDYPGITPELNYLEFEAPFLPFFDRWTRLEDAALDEADPAARTHIGILHSVLREQLEDAMTARRDLTNHGVITFEYLWTLFRPGDLLYVREDEKRSERLVRLNEALEVRDGFALKTSYVSWDGNDFGYSNWVVKIPAFKGTRGITTLEAHPLDWAKNLDVIKEEFLSRGKRVQNFCGIHCRDYNGVAYSPRFSGFTVKGRIVIDTKLYTSQHPQSRGADRPLSQKVPQKRRHRHRHRDSYDYYSDDSNDVAGNPQTKSKKSERDKHHGLSDEELLLCYPHVRGYSLKDKQWAEFHVDNFKEITWNSVAIDRLVLPAGYKELIIALTETHIKHRNTFDDVIEGKGRGLILLLTGPPGTGKTLTAESLVESIKRPLYALSASSLGTSTQSVERGLQDAFEMATRWSAVLLIDEADIFLAKRTAEHLERNSITSIFLRELEYYRGILLLTTNRIDAIDPAFQSRIHLTLEYPDLDGAARKAIWRTFTSSLEEGSEVSEEQFGELAGVEMNGREIKNVVKMAHLLAKRNEAPLGIEHVRTVLKVVEKNSRVLHPDEV